MPDRLFQASDLQVHLVPGGYVVHHKASGQVHQLNAAATLLFELSNGTSTADEVVALARTALGVPAREAGALRDGLDQLLTKGLVVAKAAPAKKQTAVKRKTAVKKTTTAKRR